MWIKPIPLFTKICLTAQVGRFFCALYLRIPKICCIFEGTDLAGASPPRKYGRIVIKMRKFLGKKLRIPKICCIFAGGFSI